MDLVASLSPGTRLGGRFAVVSAPLPGGVGTELAADDAETGTRVRVRVFPAAGRDPERRRRLLQELAAAARVSHPHVAAPLAWGSDEALGVDYAVFEDAQGDTLAALLAQRGVPPFALGVRILREAAQGLAGVHRAGLVHGAVAPAALFLARTEGERRLCVRLTGLGTRLAADAPPAGAIAPEQARGGGEATPAGDVFALGVSAYALLVGLPAEVGAALAARSRGEAVRLPSPAEVHPAVPAALAEVILCALEADPARRFPEAAAFAAALERAHSAAAAPAARPAQASVPAAPVAQVAAAPAAPAPVSAPPAVATAPDPVPAPAPPAASPPARAASRPRSAPSALAESDLGDALYIPPALSAPLGAPAPRVDSPRPEAPTGEAPKVGASQEEASQVDASAVEESQGDASKVGGSKVEASMVEAPKHGLFEEGVIAADLSGGETAARSAPDAEAPKPDGPKREAPQVEAAKAEAPPRAPAAPSAPAPAAAPSPTRPVSAAPARKVRIAPAAAGGGGTRGTLVAAAAVVALLGVGAAWKTGLILNGPSAAAASFAPGEAASEQMADASADESAEVVARAEDAPAATLAVRDDRRTPVVPAPEPDARREELAAAREEPAPAAAAEPAAPAPGPRILGQPVGAAPAAAAPRLEPRVAPRTVAAQPAAPVASGPVSATRVYASSEVDRAPVLENASDVRRALERGVPSTVPAGDTAIARVRFVVGGDGRVDLSSLEVLSATHPNLGRSAERVLSRARFDPARKDGQPVRMHVDMPIVWVVPRN